MSAGIGPFAAAWRTVAVADRDVTRLGGATVAVDVTDDRASLAAVTATADGRVLVEAADASAAAVWLWLADLVAPLRLLTPFGVAVPVEVTVPVVRFDRGQVARWVPSAAGYLTGRADLCRRGQPNDVAVAVVAAALEPPQVW